MLTESELKIFGLMCTILCKSPTIPFVWQNGSFRMKRNKHRILNFVIWLLLILTLSFKIVQLHLIIKKPDINAAILQGLFVMVLTGSVVYKLNTWLFGAELVQLIKQTMNTNAVWGKHESLNISNKFNY